MPVCLLHLFWTEWGGEIIDSIRTRILAQHNAGATGAADGRRAEVTFEKNSILGQAIEVRGLDNAVAHATHRLSPMIVRQDE